MAVRRTRKSCVSGFSFPNQLLHVAEGGNGLAKGRGGGPENTKIDKTLYDHVINDIDDERFPISPDCKNVKKIK